MGIYLFQAQKQAQKPTKTKIKNDQKIQAMMVKFEWDWVTTSCPFKTVFYLQMALL